MSILIDPQNDPPAAVQGVLTIGECRRVVDGDDHHWFLCRDGQLGFLYFDELNLTHLTMVPLEEHREWKNDLEKDITLHVEYHNWCSRMITVLPHDTFGRLSQVKGRAMFESAVRFRQKHKDHLVPLCMRQHLQLQGAAPWNNQDVQPFSCPSPTIQMRGRHDIPAIFVPLLNNLFPDD